MNKNCITLLLSLCIFTLATSVSAASPVYVDATYTPNNTGTHTFGVNSFTTINEAINAVDQGGSVYIGGGTYNENILIEKSVSLIGTGILASQGASSDSPTINGGVSTSTATITVNGASSPITVTLRNLTISHGGNGINVLQNAIMTIDHTTIGGYYKNGITFGPVKFPGFGGVSGIISNNSVTGNGPTETVSQNGIQIAENNTAMISNNKVTNHMYTVPGNWWAVGILINRSENVVVQDNTLENNQAGINILQASHNTIVANTVTGNTLTKAGIIVSDSDDTTYPATANTVKENTIMGGLVGIWTSYAYGNTYSNNIVSNSFGNGIYSWDSNNNVFSHNTLSGIHASTNDAWSIAFNGGDTKGTIGSNNNTIINNTVTTSDFGISLTKNSENNTLSGNTFNGNNADSFVSNSYTKPTTSVKNSGGMVLGATAFTFSQDLKRGNANKDVISLQQLLITGGFLQGEATGYFGTLTKKALKEWQTKNNILATGYFGPMTRAFINLRNK